MSGRRKTLVQIAANLIIAVVLISVVLWKTPNGSMMGWDSSIVVFSMTLNVIIVQRAREVRRLEKRKEHHV